MPKARMACRPKRKRNIVPLNIIKQGKRRCGPPVVVEKELIDVTDSPKNLDLPLPDKDLGMSIATSSTNLDMELSNLESSHPHEPENESAHTKRNIKMSEKWSEVNEGAFTAVVEGECIPIGSVCSNCNANACVRCAQCGPGGLFCTDCALLLHTKWNHHHYLQLWKEDTSCFIDLITQTPTITTHHCTGDTLRERTVTCFHIEGIPRKLQIGFCNCESDVVTLVKLRYWPATPSRPSIAFSFELLDWLSALMLECQVSVQAFSSTLSFIVTSKFSKMPCNIYPILINAFEEYRSLQGCIEHFCGDDKIICPACNKDDGSSVTLSVDANFGLCRKKTAGRSVHGVRGPNNMFVDQQHVDKFVQEYAHKDNSKACHNFLAGHMLRSKSRYAALDETSVMGAACRHEIPIPCFFNLKHGERIAYGVFICERLREMFPNQEINLMYDIACILVKHLKASNQLGLFDQFNFGVPVFHAYGHDSSCQMEYNPRNIPGFGLSDGEVVERLWSYLRQFSSMTKEMHPVHRVEVLSYALAHYAKMSAGKLCKLLPKRLIRAKKVKAEAIEKLNDLLPEGVSTEDVPKWVDEEKDHLISSKPQEMDNERQALLNLAKERVFLLRLKTKYADGQSIAIRLSRRINVVTKQLKSKLENFNVSRAQADKITWEDVTQLDAATFPESLRHTAVRLYHSIARANEEEYTLVKEMRNTIQYYLEVLDSLNQEIGTINTAVSRFERGKSSLLRRQQQKIMAELAKCNTFMNYGDFPELNCFTSELTPHDSTINTDPEDWESTQSSPSSDYDKLQESAQCYISESETSLSDEDYDGASELECGDERFTTKNSPISPVTCMPQILHSVSPHADVVVHDSPSDDEMEIQHWRKETFIRDEYVQSKAKSLELDEEDKQLLHRITQERDMSARYRQSLSSSFLKKSAEELQHLCHAANRATNRILAPEKMAKGPFFTSHK